jgi:hypothetical protein
LQTLERRRPIHANDTGNLGKKGRKEPVVNLSAQLNLTGFLMLLPYIYEGFFNAVKGFP